MYKYSPPNDGTMGTQFLSFKLVYLIYMRQEQVGEECEKNNPEP